MNAFTNFGKTVQKLAVNLSGNIGPSFERTQQYVKEQFGTADGKTHVPDDYARLEKRIDAMKLAHTTMLASTAQYGEGSYDYPNNLKESFMDISRVVTEKATLLSHVKSPGEVAEAMTAPPQTTQPPKTFPHAISRAAHASSLLLREADQNNQGRPFKSSDIPGESSKTLADALEEYAIAQEKVGRAQLDQDDDIDQHFLSTWNAALNQRFDHANKARKRVESARLELDVLKSRLNLIGTGDNDRRDRLDKTALGELEKREDAFNNALEDAMGVMNNALDEPDALQQLVSLAQAQLQYHQRAVDILTQVLPNIENLATEQEADYRKKRGGGFT